MYLISGDKDIKNLDYIAFSAVGNAEKMLKNIIIRSKLLLFTNNDFHRFAIFIYLEFIITFSLFCHE